MAFFAGSNWDALQKIPKTMHSPCLFELNSIQVSLNIIIFLASFIIYEIIKSNQGNRVRKECTYCSSAKKK